MGDRTNRNVFTPGLYSLIKRAFGIWRLGRLTLSFFKSYLFPLVLRQNVSKPGQVLYYYYLVLLNTNGVHVDEDHDYFTCRIGQKIVYCRKGEGFSDLENLNQIFGRNEYNEILGLWASSFKGTPGLLFDIGANVGFASLYLSNQFPRCQVVAVEPSEDNFEVLKKNLESLKKYSLEKVGVWNKNTFLEPSNLQPELGSWAYTFEECEHDTEIEARDFKQLIFKYSGERGIDILKIDIEGTEGILFSNDEYILDVLRKVKIIAIEIHDHLVKREEIIRILREAGFVLSFYGDMTFGFNKNFQE